MKYITNFFKNYISKDILKPVGRWRIENCNKQMNNKIDLSNEDHCSPCGQYALDKIKKQKNYLKKIIINIYLPQKNILFPIL